MSVSISSLVAVTSQKYYSVASCNTKKLKATEKKGYKHKLCIKTAISFYMYVFHYV